jgi:CDP-diglyceride synthetase
LNKDVQGLVYGASLVSIVMAIYMFATGKKDTGIFIGLWAPTFLGLGTFFNSETHLVKSDDASGN